MFKKALMAFAAVTAVSAAFAATSFAADLAATADFEKGTVVVDAGLDGFTADDQVTVLLIEKGADEDGITEDEILYINQAAGNGANDIFGTMGVLGGTLDTAKTYVLKVGSDTGADIMEFEIAFVAEGREIQLGDCDGITGITIGDASAVVNHIISVSALTGDALIAADCDGITGVTIGDASAVVNHILGITTLGTVTVTD